MALTRLRSILFGFLPPILGVFVLWTLEVTSTVERPVVSKLAEKPSDTRLVVFWVDSLDLRDVQKNRMPKMSAKLNTGLHGGVTPCADAVSVACFEAMSTGIDRFSLFSFHRNFSPSATLPDGSILEAMKTAGVRMGYIGVHTVKPLVSGFHWVKIIEEKISGALAIREGMAALERENLDFLVIHIFDPDIISHNQGPHSETYNECLIDLDNLIEAAAETLKPSDHYAVIGDHGHTDDGRHFAGLYVPTYSAYWGPKFSRPLEHTMNMTDNGAIWARLFGFKFGETQWLEQYFAGAHVPSTTELPDLKRVPTEVPIWATGVCIAMLLLLIFLVPWRFAPIAGTIGRRLQCALLIMVIAQFTLGVYYLDIWEVIRYQPRWFQTSIGVSTSLLALGVLWFYFNRETLGGMTTKPLKVVLLFQVGALLFALPSVYKFGGTYAAMTGLLVTTAAMFAWGTSKTSIRIFAAATIIVLWTVYNPAVRAFAVRWFPYYSEGPQTLQWPIIIGFTALTFLAVPRQMGKRWFAVGTLCGIALGCSQSLLPAWAFLVPCTLALPTTMSAFYISSMAPIAVAMAIPAMGFFYKFDVFYLAPMAAVWAAWALWSRCRHASESPLEVSTSTLIFILLCFWTSLGCRLNWLDFTFYMDWLGPDDVAKKQWHWIGFFTLSKYLLFPLLGVMTALHIAPRFRAAMAGVKQIATLKAGLVLTVAVSFTSFSSAEAPPFIMSDIVQEAGLWLIILTVTFLVPSYDKQPSFSVDPLADTSVSVS